MGRGALTNIRKGNAALARNSRNVAELGVTGKDSGRALQPHFMSQIARFSGGEEEVCHAITIQIHKRVGTGLRKRRQDKPRAECLDSPSGTIVYIQPHNALLDVIHAQQVRTQISIEIKDHGLFVRRSQFNVDGYM